MTETSKPKHSMIIFLNASNKKDSKRHTRLSQKKKSIERVTREYQVGIKHEKSALDNFAEKYVTE